MRLAVGQEKNADSKPLQNRFKRAVAKKSLEDALALAMRPIYYDRHRLSHIGVVRYARYLAVRISQISFYPHRNLYLPLSLCFHL